MNASEPVRSVAAPTPTASSAPVQEPGSPLTDGAPVAFRDAFGRDELGYVWNRFGESAGRREVTPTAQGLIVKVLRSERPWDAVGVRTARAKLDGDFDLRARFRDFSATGNGSVKLIVVDAAQPRGEAAYVERLRIDGKNLFKFGGDVNGTLETWGMLATDAEGADLRLERKGGVARGSMRTSETGLWTAIGPAQPTPPSMPRVLKFGVKTSAAPEQTAPARWTELVADGAITRIQ